MQSYKFSVGERVEFRPDRSGDNIPHGTYTIVRRLPFEHKTCSYRVKNALDGHERVIPESQLTRR